MEDNLRNSTPTLQLENHIDDTSSKATAGDQNKSGSRSSSLERMRQNLKEKVSNIGAAPKSRENLFEEEKPTGASTYCKEHTDELIQFYSMTNKVFLCSECLLSGAFAGREVLSLKKAADKIRPDLENLLLQVTGKAEKLKTWQGKLDEKKSGLDNFVPSYRSEVKSKFDELRNAIDKKEKEVIEQIEKISKDKQDEIESKFKIIRETQEQIVDFQKVIQGKLSILKDGDLCEYYSSKAPLIKNFVDQTCVSKFEELQKIEQIESLKEDSSLNKYQEGVTKALEVLNSIKLTEEKVQKSELKLLQRRLNTESNKEAKEALSSLDIIGKKSIKLTTMEPATFLPVQTPSPFSAFKEDLEDMSPVHGANKEAMSPCVATEDTYRKLFEKIEEAKRINNNGMDLSRSVSKLSITDHNQSVSKISQISLLESQAQVVPKLNLMQTYKEKDAPKKSWEGYINSGGINSGDDNNRSKRRELGISTSKVGDLDRYKVTPPKSYIQDFSRTKLSIATTSSTALKKDLFSNSSTNGLYSTKNLRTLVQEDSAKLANNSWKFDRKREADTPSFSSGTNKSFGSTSFTQNLRKLKKEMNTWGDE